MSSPSVRDAEPYARRAYTMFLLLRPDLAVEGLFFARNWYWLVCPAVGPAPGDRDIVASFVRVLPMAVPLEITAQRPADAIEIPQLTREELDNGYGISRGFDEIATDVGVRLPRTFPLIGIRDAEVIKIQVSREVTAEERETLQRTWDDLGTICTYAIEVAADDPRQDRSAVDVVDGLAVGAVRLAPPSLPIAVRHAVEEDEDRWRVASAERTLRRAYASEAIWPEIHGNACILGTAFPPPEIRPLLSLYPTVVIEAPMRENFAETMSSLGIKPREFSVLVRRGTIRVVVPHAIDSYDGAWLADLVESAPANVVFSRRLLAATIDDQRQRMPFFDGLATPEERRTLARAVQFGIGDDDEAFLPMRRALVRALGSHWAYGPRMRAGRGAMAGLSGGLATLATELVKEIHGVDAELQLGSVAARIEWAGALGADYVPHVGENYSEENAAGLLLALLSGVDVQKPQLCSREITVTKDLLAVSGDVDVEDLATYWGSGDAARLRTLVRGIAQPGRTAEEIREIVDLWNREVAAYEREPDRLRAYAISSILLSSLSAAANAIEPMREYAPLLALMMPWVMPYLVANLSDRWATSSEFAGELHDWMQGIAAKTMPPAVMISRARKRLGTMKFPKSTGGTR